MALLLFVLPYHIPVTPSVSLSYVTGFSNRAATIIFAIGAAAFAILTGGDLGARKAEDGGKAKDQPLGWNSLVAALATVCALCMVRLFPFAHHHIGAESEYALNRLQMLVSGLRPYKDFEFAYGPAHLYVPVLCMKIFGCTAVTGYYIWWMLQWLVGTAMLWVVIRLIDLPGDRRQLVFWALFGMQLSSIVEEGTVYTPVRIIGSACLLLFVHFIWRRWRLPYVAAGIGVLVVAIGLGISPEQGTGITAGLFCWFVLLTARNRFPAAACILFAAGTLGVFVLFLNIGVFASLASFGAGAYAFPLLPSPSVLVILFAYIGAACMAVLEIREGNFESMVIPLAIGGFSMLPAAMGRCDLGHLQLAAPAFLIGVAAIEAQPSIRAWWSPLAVITLVVPLVLLPPASLLHVYLRHGRQNVITPPFPAKGGALTSADDAAAVQPCKVIYRAPTIWPAFDRTVQQSCLDTGYFMGPVDAFTPAAIHRKILELDQKPRRPILLANKPMEDQMRPLDVNPAVLGRLELAPFVPRVRNEPVTYEPIFAYIRQNYTPDPEPVGDYRIWRHNP